MKLTIELIKVQISQLISQPKARANKLAKLLYFMSPLFFLYFSYSYALNIYIAMPNGKKELALYFMAGSSFVFSLYGTFISGSGYFTKFKDFDFLMALPISKMKILIAKSIALIFHQIMVGLIVLVPSIFIYGIKTQEGLMYYFGAFMGAIPMLVIAISLGAAVTIILQKIPGLNRFPNLLRNLAYILILFFILISTSVGEAASTSGGNVDVRMYYSVIDMFKKFAFPAYAYGVAITEKKLLLLLVVIAAGIACFAFFLIGFSKIFISTNTVSTSRKVSNFKLKDQRSSSVLGALIKRELKRYFLNFMYVMNTAIGQVMLLGGVIYISWLVFRNEQEIQILLMQTNVAEGRMVLFGITCIMLGSLGFLSNTAAASISLEGKNFWIIKSSPITAWQVFISKIFVNVVVIAVPNIIATIILSIVLGFNFQMILLALIISILNGVVVGLLGISMGITFPKLDFDREIVVIKQSVSVFLSMGVGIALLVGQIFLVLTIQGMDHIPYKTALILICFHLIYFIILCVYLHFVGTKKYSKLSN